MPLFMDVHNGLEGVTVEDVAAAHRRDLEIQDRYDVKYVRYWFNADSGKIFCLAEAPSREAADRVHRESHGLAADEILPVVEG
jgi:hypothetical protein